MLEAIAWSTSQRHWEGLDDVDHAQHYALTQISSLLVNELSNGMNFSSLFGGGYDLLMWDGAKFDYRGDATFLFLSMDTVGEVSGGSNDFAPVLMRQTEVEECLVLRAIIPPNGIGAEADENERAAIVAPLTALGRKHRMVSPHDWSEISHFAQRVFLVVVGTRSDGAYEHWAGGFMGPAAAGFSLETSKASGKIKFFLPKDVMDLALGAARRQFTRIPPAV